MSRRSRSRSRKTRMSKKRCSTIKSRKWRKGYKTSRGTRVRGVCARKSRKSRTSRKSRKARKGSRRTSSRITKKTCLSQAGKRWVSRYRTRLGPVRGSCRSIHNYVAVAPLAPVVGFKPRTPQPYQAARQVPKSVLGALGAAAKPASVKAAMNGLTKDECMAMYELPAGYAPENVKKQYRKLALKYHPDKGGDAQFWSDKFVPCQDVLLQ